jgi:hypothetical protein
MDIDLATLPDDVETLQRMVRSLASERASLSEAQAEIERLHLIIKKLQRSQFGRLAEQLDDGQLQLGFEDLNADVARTEARLPPTKAGYPDGTRRTAKSASASAPRGHAARSRASSVPLLRRQAAADRRDGQRDARPCAGAASGHPNVRGKLENCKIEFRRSIDCMNHNGKNGRLTTS